MMIYESKLISKRVLENISWKTDNLLEIFKLKDDCKQSFDTMSTSALPVKFIFISNTQRKLESIIL